MKPIKIPCIDNMVDITSDEISFALIDNMYEGNRPGFGLQIDSGLDEEKVRTLCTKTSQAVLEYTQPTVPEKVLERLSGIVTAHKAFPQGYRWSCPKCQHRFPKYRVSSTEHLESEFPVKCPDCSLSFSVRIPP